MKILCCCEGGNTRSVTLATLLKYRFRDPSRSAGYDVLTCSLGKNDSETLDMLFEWADRILVVEPDMVKEIPEKHHVATRVIPLGRDIWGMSMHPELVPLAHALLVGAGFEPKQTVDEILARARKKYGTWSPS
jgi:hypothetical protein